METYDRLIGQLFAEPAKLLSRNLVFGDVVQLLHLHLCGKAVAVPALWEHDIVALHALVTGHEINVAPVESVPDMEVSRRIRRGSVDDVLRLLRLPVKVID